MMTPPRPWRFPALLFWALVISLLAALLGLALDGLWHEANPFTRFWTPPHLIIYGGLAAGGGVLLLGLAHPRARSHSAFGPPLRVPFVAFPAPAGLLFVGLGLLQALLGGLLDSAWHATLGANETLWSYPHMLVLFGGFLAVLGLLVVSQALPAPSRARASVFLLGAGLMALFAFPLGPLTSSRAGLVLWLNNAGFYRLDPQSIKIGLALLAHSVHAGNPVLVPALVPLAMVAPMAAVRALASRRFAATLSALVYAAILVGATSLFLALVWAQPGFLNPASPLRFDSGFLPASSLNLLRGLLVISLPLDLLSGPRLERAVPGALRTHLGPAAAGLSLALAHGAAYGFDPLGLALAPLSGIGGALVGRAIARVARAPSPRRVAASVGLLSVLCPLLLGSLDLYLRFAL